MKNDRNRTRSIRRGALLARLGDAYPRLILCVAPAGYGKTTLAAQYAAEYPASRTIDCAELAGAAALSQIFQEACPQAEDERSLIVFDSAELLSNDATSLLLRLAVSASEKVDVLICSRVPLGVRPGRMLPPHAVLTLRTPDLALSDDEAQELAVSNGVNDADARRIVALANGWPILLLVLARLARERRLADAPETELLHASFERLRDYLATEVAAGLSPEMQAMLRCIDALGAPRIEVLQDVLGIENKFELLRMLSDAPLVTRKDGCATVHRVVIQTMGDDEEAARRYRQAAAGFYKPEPLPESLAAGQCVEVSLLQERLSVGGRAVKLVGKDLGFVAYLCKVRGGATREELQDAIWPELEGNFARNALYSTLYRLRKRSGESSWIENVGNAYRLSADVIVDLWEVESMLSRRNGVDPAAAVELRRQFDALRRHSYPRLQCYEWFAAVDYRFRDGGRRIARMLVDGALSQEDYHSAIALADELLREDSCDEWAQEVRIRALISLGQTREAARFYREYRNVVRLELATEPSRELRAVVEAAISA